MSRLAVVATLSLLLLLFMARPGRAEERIVDLQPIQKEEPKGTGGDKEAPKPAGAEQPLAPAGAPEALTGREEKTTLDRILPKIAERITIGGQVRLRFEYRRPITYAANFSDDNDFALLRTRLHLDAEITEDISAFLQIQDSRVWGEEASTTSDEEGLDIHQAYFEARNLFHHPISVRAGRQELSYGDQRLVSPLDWGNTGRAFDAVKVRYEREGLWVDAFSAWVVEDFTPQDRDFTFSGLYANYSRLAPTEIETYWFHRDDADRAYIGEDGRSGPRRDNTVGFRVVSRGMGLDGTAEAAYQFGDFAHDDTRAYAIALKGGYTLKEAPYSPRVGLEYTLGSGDNNPSDEEHETFDPLFPFGHFFQGFLDVFGWKNGHDLKGSVGIKPAPDWKVELALHGLWLHEEKDAWYNAGGGVIRQDITGDSGTEIGLEIDIHAKYNIGKAFFLWFGYSHLFPGKFVRRTADAQGLRDADMDWVFCQAGVNF